MTEVQVVTVPVSFLEQKFKDLESKMALIMQELSKEPAEQKSDRSWLTANGFRVRNHIGQTRLEQLIKGGKVESYDFGDGHIRYRWKEENA